MRGKLAVGGIASCLVDKLGSSSQEGSKGRPRGDVRTTMIYTHCVPSRTLKEMKSPLDF